MRACSLRCNTNMILVQVRGIRVHTGNCTIKFFVESEIAMILVVVVDHGGASMML